MKTRHRTPSIFNLSMVDVLCCALGCVILLWLLNLREAKQKAAQAGRADEEVTTLRSRLGALDGELADLRAQFASAQARVSASERDLAATRRRLAGAEAEARDTADSLKETRGDRETLSARSAQLAKDLAGLRARYAAVVEALSQRTRAAGDLADKLKDAEARAREATDEATDYRARAAAEAALAKGLEKEVARRGEALLARDRELEQKRAELALVRQGMEALRGEKKALAGEAERARAAADNRFAGIALTGKRVVFLVDMSGSMERVDLKTLSPDKWPGVRDAVVKIMRSLPELEKFQVILFSNEFVFPLGRKGEWLDYDRASPAAVAEALTQTKPHGDTNMYGALDAAFRYRAQGLDTVYLFSDGLPTEGPGLTKEQEAKLSEAQQGDILGRYVRRKLQTEWNREAPGRVRINAIGFFFESPDVGAFLWALARENDGSFVGMSRP